MQTIIPAPQRVIRLEPMMPMKPLIDREATVAQMKNLASFLAIMLFVTCLVVVCLMVDVTPATV